MKKQPLDFEKPIFELERKLEDIKRHSRSQDINLDPEVKRMEAKIEEMKRETYDKLTAWQRVLARATFRAADAVCPVSESLRRAIEPYAPYARIEQEQNA